MAKENHMKTHEQSPWYLAQRPCGATFPDKAGVSIGRSPAAGMRSEKGTALIVSLLILLVLTIVALSLINTSTFEIGISGNERTRVEAFYAAEAGIQRALSQLPRLEPIPETRIGSDSQYWSGSGRDRRNPTRS